MATYDRVTTADGRRIILRDLEQVTFAGAPALRGVEVDRYGEDVTPKGADLRIRIIHVDMVKRRVPLRVNLKHDELEATTEDKRMPYYPAR